MIDIPESERGDVHELVCDLAERAPRDARLLVASSPTSHNGWRRVGVLALGESVRVMADRWLLDPDVDALTADLGRIRSLRVGAWDHQYARRWRFAWTVDGPFALYTSRGRIWWLEDGQLHRARTRRVWVPEEFDRVELYIGDDAVERGVRLIQRDGRPLSVARTKKWISRLEPTETGVRLVVEDAWARALGARVAECLRLPFAAYTWSAGVDQSRGDGHPS